MSKRDMAYRSSRLGMLELLKDWKKPAMVVSWPGRWPDRSVAEQNNGRGDARSPGRWSS